MSSRRHSRGKSLVFAAGANRADRGASLGGRESGGSVIRSVSKKLLFGDSRKSMSKSAISGAIRRRSLTGRVFHIKAEDMKNVVRPKESKIACFCECDLSQCRIPKGPKFESKKMGGFSQILRNRGKDKDLIDELSDGMVLAMSEVLDIAELEEKVLCLLFYKKT